MEIEPIPGRQINLRNPFKLRRLPWLAKLYSHAYHGRRRRSRMAGIMGFIARRLYRLVRHLPIGATGTFTLKLPDRDATLQFNARNTQFHAVYLPKYSQGYEVETSGLIDAFAGDLSSFWDIGANWGYFSLHLASQPSFKGTIQAFEPAKETYQDLQSMVEQASLASKVTCHQMALSDTCGQVDITLPDQVHSGLATIGGPATEGGITSATADSLSITPPDLIKVDVEGHELAVLQGASRVIRESKPWIIMESWRSDPATTLPPLILLEEAGYRLYCPVWVDRSSKALTHLTTRLPAQDAQTPYTLALLPVTASQRHLLGEHLNLFAGHESRLNALHARFPLIDLNLP